VKHSSFILQLPGTPIHGAYLVLIILYTYYDNKNNYWYINGENLYIFGISDECISSKCTHASVILSFTYRLNTILLFIIHRINSYRALYKSYSLLLSRIQILFLCSRFIFNTFKNNMKFILILWFYTYVLKNTK